MGGVHILGREWKLSVYRHTCARSAGKCEFTLESKDGDPGKGVTESPFKRVSLEKDGLAVHINSNFVTATGDMDFSTVESAEVGDFVSMNNVTGEEKGFNAIELTYSEKALPMHGLLGQNASPSPTSTAQA